MLSTLGPLSDALVFADDPGGPTRYWWDNDGFSPGDATVLATMLMHYQPKRVVEVGAGYSTAVMLDVSERYLADPPKIVCIDPEPGRLRSVLRGDEAGLTIHETIVQNLPIELFTTLEANDILFIDSSHVLKLGSDVSLLFLEVLPRLRPGVVVHIHDIATSFEYPLEWYEEGRAWNEAPALRAFLAFNQAYEIPLFLRLHEPIPDRGGGAPDAAGAAAAQGRAGGQHVGQLLDAAALACTFVQVRRRRRVHVDESASLLCVLVSTSWPWASRRSRS